MPWADHPDSVWTAGSLVTNHPPFMDSMVDIMLSNMPSQGGEGQNEESSSREPPALEASAATAAQLQQVSRHTSSCSSDSDGVVRPGPGAATASGAESSTGAGGTTRSSAGSGGRSKGKKTEQPVEHHADPERQVREATTIGQDGKPEAAEEKHEKEGEED